MSDLRKLLEECRKAGSMEPFYQRLDDQKPWYRKSVGGLVVQGWRGLLRSFRPAVEPTCGNTGNGVKFDARKIIDGWYRQEKEFEKAFDRTAYQREYMRRYRAKPK